MQKIISDDVVKASVLDGAEAEMRARFESLINVVRETNSDIIGVRELLYKKNYKYYEAFRNDVLQRMTVAYDIKIDSVS